VLPEVQVVVQRAGREDRVLGAHVSELFADCFASWVVGPAYGLAVAWLGFGVGATNEDEDSDSHPSPRRRIHQVTLTLRRAGGLDDAATRIEALDDEAAGSSATGAADPQLGDPDPLTAWCDELRDLLAGRLDSGRYQRWPAALGLAPSLVASGALRAPLGPPPTVTDVVNAAWWARVHNPQIAERISARARVLLP
jgi:hypothetical protein